MPKSRDALTKPLPSGILEKILVEGRWALVYDPQFTSAKKLKKASVQAPSQDTSSVNVFGACEFVMHVASSNWLLLTSNCILAPMVQQGTLLPFDLIDHFATWKRA